MGDLPALITQA